MDNELNYAKQSQFTGYSNERKLLFYNELWTMNNEQRTNKNKPNQTQLQTNQPIFQKILQKPLFSWFFTFFFRLFYFVSAYASVVARLA